jgi:hypothetical protein
MLLTRSLAEHTTLTSKYTVVYGLSYHVSNMTCWNSITKHRQWRRPEIELAPTERPLSMKETSIENVDKRASRRMSTRILSPVQSPLKSQKEHEQEEELRKARALFNQIDLVIESVNRARRVNAMIMSDELLSDSELDGGAKETVSYMLRIGNYDKCGYLMKQSKLLGR